LHSPIALQEFDAQKYRVFVQTLSDEALIKEGKQVRWLSGDGSQRCRAHLMNNYKSAGRNIGASIQNDRRPKLYRFVNACNRILKYAPLKPNGIG